jgi:hypothetical protein
MLPIAGSTEVLLLALLFLLCLLIVVALRRFRSTLRDERTRRIEAEQTLTRTNALESLSRALSKAQTPAEVTYACLSELLPSAGAAAGAVAVVSDDGNQLAVVQATGYPDPETAAHYAVALSSKTVLADVARRQKTVAFTSRAERSAAIANLTLDPILEEAEAAIILPLLVSGFIEYAAENHGEAEVVVDELAEEHWARRA